MKFRIRVDLIFEKQTDADLVFDYAKKKLALVVNLLVEKSFIELEHCYHDETPPQPCVVIKHLEKP